MEGVRRPKPGHLLGSRREEAAAARAEGERVQQAVAPRGQPPQRRAGGGVVQRHHRAGGRRQQRRRLRVSRLSRLALSRGGWRRGRQGHGKDGRLVLRPPRELGAVRVGLGARRARAARLAGPPHGTHGRPCPRPGRRPPRAAAARAGRSPPPRARGAGCARRAAPRPQPRPRTERAQHAALVEVEGQHVAVDRREEVRRLVGPLGRGEGEHRRCGAQRHRRRWGRVCVERDQEEVALAAAAGEAPPLLEEAAAEERHAWRSLGRDALAFGGDDAAARPG